MDFFDFLGDDNTESGPEFPVGVKTEEEIEKWATDPDFTEVQKAINLLRKPNGI
jgi:hypothetical protein